jgi:ABC-type multidrug transport system fused ATPase/permease subunit
VRAVVPGRPLSASRLVLGEGRVLELGSHTELMEREGLYAELYRLQSRAYH